MKNEMEAYADNQIWELIELPTQRMPYTSRGYSR